MVLFSKQLELKFSWLSVAAEKMEDWIQSAKRMEQGCHDYTYGLCKNADTLWLKWINIYIIKDHCIWTMNIPAQQLRTMKKF